MLLLLLTACPAADLGIELPPEGAESISAEDLRRDTEMMLKDGAAGWESRMEAMHAVRERPLASTDTRLCMRQGTGPATPLWAPLDLVDGKVPLGEAVDAAALISLAKAWDTLAEKPGARISCLGAGDGTRIDSFSPDATAMQSLDFRVLATHLRKR